jgi:hypothetical protein
MLPVLIAQSAQPSQPAPTLAEAPLWTYGLTYSRQPDEQADVIVAASFNVPGPVAEATMSAPMGSLAQQDYGFSTRLGYRVGADGTRYLDTLALTAAQAAPSPGDQWPNVFCLAPDGALVPLAAGSPAGATVVYRFPADTIPASHWPIITLEWPGLSVATAQNARGSLTLRPHREPSGDGSAPATPIVEASSPVAPLNVWLEPFDITGEGTTPVDALQGALETLFGTLDGGLITLAVAYRHRILSGAAPDDGVVATVPVALCPDLVLGPATVAAIGGAMTEWQTNNPLPGTGGAWIFSLTFYSGMDGTPPRPLLSLDRLTYRVNPQPSRA